MQLRHWDSGVHALQLTDMAARALSSERQTARSTSSSTWSRQRHASVVNGRSPCVHGNRCSQCLFLDSAQVLRFGERRADVGGHRRKHPLFQPASVSKRGARLTRYTYPGEYFPVPMWDVPAIPFVTEWHQSSSGRPIQRCHDVQVDAMATLNAPARRGSLQSVMKGSPHLAAIYGGGVACSRHLRSPS